MTDDPAVAALQKETRRCACRGLITADPKQPFRVEMAVRNHQETDRHRVWSAAGAMDLTLTESEKHAPVPTALLRRVV